MVYRLQSLEHVASARCLYTISHGIRFTKIAQFVHETQNGRIIFSDGNSISHAPDQTSSRQQIAECPHIGHRQDPGADSTMNSDFGGQKGLTQFKQGLATKQGPKKHAAGFKGEPTLDQLTDRIVGPMQRHAVENTIMTLRGQRECLTIRHMFRRPKSAIPEFGLTAHHNHSTSIPMTIILKTITDLIGYPIEQAIRCQRLQVYALTPHPEHSTVNQLLHGMPPFGKLPTAESATVSHVNPCPARNDDAQPLCG